MKRVKNRTANVIQSVKLNQKDKYLPGRILALDLGTKTIGLAVSDLARTFAQSLGVIRRKGFEKDLARIGETILQQQAKQIVLGLPLHLSGAESEGSLRSRQFAKMLEEKFDLKVHLVDESLSTARAEEILIEANMSRKKRKKKIDGLAAAIILQSFLNEQMEMERMEEENDGG